VVGGWVCIEKGAARCITAGDAAFGRRSDCRVEVAPPVYLWRIVETAPRRKYTMGRAWPPPGSSMALPTLTRPSCLGRSLTRLRACVRSDVERRLYLVNGPAIRFYISFFSGVFGSSSRCYLWLDS